MPRISTPAHVVSDVQRAMEDMPMAPCAVWNLDPPPLTGVLRQQEVETQMVGAHQIILDACSGPWDMNSWSCSVRVNSNLIGWKGDLVI